MVLRAGAGRERLWARSPAGNGIASLVPSYPYTNATLDMAFTANAYTYGDRSLDLTFTSTASDAFYFRDTPAMPSYSSLTAFLTGIGGTFTRASNGTYFDATGTLQTASSNVPRLDYNPATLAARGYLAEEARTNSIPNNSGVGAVAGSPGTLPSSGWFTSFSANAGTLTRTVVGTGVENGISYVDIQFSGLPVGAGFCQIGLSSSTAVTAASGENWAASAYVRISSGSAANITSPVISLNENTAAGGFVTSGSQSLSLSALALNVGRTTYVRTLSGGGTVGRLLQSIVFNYSALPIDATFRIGLPQLELVPTATSTASSPIVTTSAAVARAADVLSVPTAGWYNSAAGTLYAEFMRAGSGPLACIYSCNDLTTSNRLAQFVIADNAGILNRSLGGGVNYDPPQIVQSLSANTIYKTALSASVALGDAAVLGGGSVATNTIATMPIGVTILELGQQGSSFFLNGWIRRIFYVPPRLADATLQSITT